MKTTQSLVRQLLENVHTSQALKSISQTLEEISQNPAFKDQANEVVSDATLTTKQKKSQLLFLIKTIDDSILYEFFSDILSSHTFWIFQNNRIDYFDRFVQGFQMATEEVGVLHFTTAIDLHPPELKAIATDLSTALGYKVVLDHEVNQGLIGGVQIRVENMVYDFSLRTKFQQFQRLWLNSIDKTNKKVGRHSV